MKKVPADLKKIYGFAAGITGLLIILDLFFPRVSIDDETRYYFFLAGRFKNHYQYSGGPLEVRAEPKGYKERPTYIFNNRLVLLYYSYICRLSQVPEQYVVSFDIFPERFFKKIYALDGKIISFRIDLLESEREIKSLDYYLDLTGKSRSSVKIISREKQGGVVDEKEVSLKTPVAPINRMRFRIVACGGIKLYINDSLILDAPAASAKGIFNLTKFPGSQFQMDNLRLVDSITGKKLIDENFNKSVNIVEVEDLFFPNKDLFFIIMLSFLLILGFFFDFFIYQVLRSAWPRPYWLELIVPQGLVILAVNRLLSFSFTPVLCALFAILAAKVSYLFYIKNDERV